MKKLQKTVAVALAMTVAVTSGGFTTVSAKTAPGRYVKSLKISEAAVALESGAQSSINAFVKTRGNANKKVKVRIAKDARKVVDVKVGKANKKGVSTIRLTAADGLTQKESVEFEVLTYGKSKKGKALTKTVKVIVAPKTADATPVVPTTTTGETTNSAQTKPVDIIEPSDFKDDVDETEKDIVKDDVDETEKDVVKDDVDETEKDVVKDDVDETEKDVLVIPEPTIDDKPVKEDNKTDVVDPYIPNVIDPYIPEILEKTNHDAETVKLLKEFMETYEENDRKNKDTQAEALKTLKELLANSEDNKATQKEIVALLEELLETYKSDLEVSDSEDGENSKADVDDNSAEEEKEKEEKQENIGGLLKDSIRVGDIAWIDVAKYEAKNMFITAKSTNPEVAVAVDETMVLGVGEGTAEIDIYNGTEKIETLSITVSGTRAFNKNQAEDPFRFEHELSGAESEEDFMYMSSIDDTYEAFVVKLPHKNDCEGLAISYEIEGFYGDIPYEAYLVERDTNKVENLCNDAIVEATDESVTIYYGENVKPSGYVVVKYLLDGKYGDNLDPNTIPKTEVSGYWVAAVPEGMEVNIGKTKLQRGETTHIEAQTYPVKGLTDCDVHFKSLNPDIVQVLGNNTLVALNTGKAEIIAECDGLESQKFSIDVSGIYSPIEHNLTPGQDVSPNGYFYKYVEYQDATGDYSYNSKYNTYHLVSNALFFTDAMTDIELYVQNTEKAIKRGVTVTYYILNPETGEILDELGHYYGTSDMDIRMKIADQYSSYAVVTVFYVRGEEDIEPGTLGQVHISGQIVPFDFEISSSIGEYIELAQGQLKFVEPEIKAKDGRTINRETVYVNIESEDPRIINVIDGTAVLSMNEGTTKVTIEVSIGGVTKCLTYPATVTSESMVAPSAFRARSNEFYNISNGGGYYSIDNKYTKIAREYYVVPMDIRSLDGYKVNIPKSCFSESNYAEGTLRVVDGETGVHVWVEGGYFNKNADNEDSVKIYLNPEYFVEDTCSEQKYFVLIMDYSSGYRANTYDTVNVSGIANNPALN